MRITFSLQFSFIAALLSSLFIRSSFAQAPYVLEDTTVIHRLDAQVDVLVDPTESISIEQVANPAFQQRFLPSGGNLTFGYSRAAIWLKVRTKARSPHTTWYLEIPAPFLEYVDFYQLRGDTWHHSMAGYYRKQSIREVPHTGHVLPLSFNADSTSTVYIRIAGLSPKTFPLFAIEKQRFIEKVRFEDIGYGIFFGILLVMFGYNLLLYLTLKQANFFLYICTIVCTFLIFASASGYAGRFLWPEHPMMNFYAGRLTLGVLSGVLAVFTIRFLEVRHYSKIMYYALLSLIPLGVLAIILVTTEILSSAGNNLISLSTIIYMTTGIVCRAKGNKTATYFIAAWAIYFSGGLLLTLRNSGVFHYNFWTTHFVEIGAALETTIIAFALGDRYHQYKKEKEEIQLLAFKVQQDATDRLESKVRERTEQLSKAYEELRTTLETNILQTKIIEDKNAELDAFFYNISHDLKGPISSLLGLSYLARLEVKDEQALEYIERQHQQVDRLNNIITGLINLTKLNQPGLRKEKIDFEKMVSDCIASFHSLPNFAGISFRKDIQPGIDFHSEWTLLNAILQNLIENGIKYSRKESPFVKIAVRHESPWIIIEVEDNGQGIPGKHQSKIFEMFYRASQDANGTGLGLYILKRSVDKLNGVIEIKSEVDVGSTFTVKLPVPE